MECRRNRLGASLRSDPQLHGRHAFQAAPPLRRLRGLLLWTPPRTFHATGREARSGGSRTRPRLEWVLQEALTDDRSATPREPFAAIPLQREYAG